MELRKLKITKISPPIYKNRVYDLHVPRNSNFFITDSEVLTHNCDAITFQGQAALKSIMETYSAGVRFILTSNFPDKVLTAIRSRCTEVEFTGVAKAEIARIVSEIFDKEEVQYELEDLKKLVNTHYPDIRKTIRDSQFYTDPNTKILSLPDELSKTTSDYDLIIDQLVNKTTNSWKNIRQHIADNSIKTYEPVYSYIYQNIDKFKADRIPQVIISVADAQYQAGFVIDKEITFMAAMANILK